MLRMFWSFPRRGERLLLAVPNATIAARSVRPWSAIMDQPPHGSITNVKTTGVQHMTSSKMASKFQDSWTDEMFHRSPPASRLSVLSKAVKMNRVYFDA